MLCLLWQCLLVSTLSGTCLGTMSTSKIVKPSDDLFTAQTRRQGSHLGIAKKVHPGEHLLHQMEEYSNLTSTSETSQVTETLESEEFMQTKSLFSGLRGSIESASLVKRADPAESIDDDVPIKLFDSSGRICILATFNISFHVKSQRKGFSPKPFTMTHDPQVSGKCKNNPDPQVLVLMWGTIKMKFYFRQRGDGRYWQNRQIRLEFDKSDPAFQSLLAGKDTGVLLSQEGHPPFSAEVGRVYTCDHPMRIDMLDRAGEVRLVASFHDMLLQPFIGETQTFGRERRCWRIRDETVPVAVASTLAVITLLTIAAYAIFRHFKVSKVQYDTME